MSALNISDFFGIETHTTYAQKSVVEKRLLFMGTPPRNDKIAKEADKNTKGWLTEWK